MLNYVKGNYEIKLNARLLADVHQLEAQSFVRSALTQLERLGRDFVSPEPAVVGHISLQLLEHLTGTTTNLADRPGRQAVSLHQSNNLLRLPRGLFDVPQGFLLE